MLSYTPHHRVEQRTYWCRVHFEPLGALSFHFTPGPDLLLSVKIKPLDESIHFLPFYALFYYLLQLCVFILGGDVFELFDLLVVG